MKDFHGYEYEISYYWQLENTSKFIHDKENEYFSILSSDIMETSTSLPVGLSKCQASHLCFPVDFSAFSLKQCQEPSLAIQTHKNTCNWTYFKLDIAYLHISFSSLLSILTLILPTWRIWWAPNNASRWQMGFTLAFKGLNKSYWKNTVCINSSFYS